MTADDFQRQAAERVTPYAEYAGAKLLGGMEATRPVEALGLASLPSRHTTDEYGLPPPGPPPADLLSKDQFDASAYKRPGLEWEDGETEARAAARAAVHDRQAYRDSLVARSDTGWLGQAAGFGLGLGAAALDPTNYVPLLGPASKAAMVARFGRVGGALLGHGADAALNTGLFEPLAVETARVEGRSYGWEEAGSDILTNALGGAVLGTAVGEAARALGFGHRPPITPEVLGKPEAPGISGLAEAEPLPTIAEPTAPPIVGVPEAGAGISLDDMARRRGVIEGQIMGGMAPAPWGPFDVMPYDELREVVERDGAALVDVQAHGIAGANPEHRLDALLTGGIDKGRTFHTGPLGQSGDANLRAAGLGAKVDAPYVLLGAPGERMKEGGIRAVVVNGAAKANLDDLKARYPGVTFLAPDEVAGWAKGDHASPPPPEAGAGVVPRRAGQPPLRVDDLMRRADAADLALDQIDRGEPVDVGRALANDPAVRASQTGLDQAGGAMSRGIVGGMYDMLHERYSRGETTEAGAPSLFLQVAKAIDDRGRPLTREEFPALAADVMTARKAGSGPEFQAAMRGVIDKWAGAPGGASRVGDEVGRRLAAAGVPEAEARPQAALWQSFFATMGRRAGLDPGALFDRYRVGVERGGEAEAGALFQRRPPGYIAGMGGKTAERELPREQVQAALDELKARYKGKGVQLEMNGRSDGIVLSKIFIATDVRGKGLATEVMRDIAATADRLGLPVGLTASNEFGSSTRRLEKFYARFGFVPNKGKNKDFRFTEGMTRPPKEGGETLNQGGAATPRGSISFAGDGRTVIRLFQSADASTFLHESGHLFARVMRDLAERDGAPEGIARDWRTLRDWLGVKEGEGLGVEHEEKLARGFEAYLRDGEAPTPALKGVFETIKGWLRDVYKSLTDLGVTPSPEVREVFDRMLGGEEVPGPIDTRGAGVRYHGTSSPVEGADDWHNATLNYYGPTFYATDAHDIAVGYSKKGAKAAAREGRLDPTIYRVDEKHPVKTLDMERPVPDYLKKAIEDGYERFANGLDGLAMSYMEEHPTGSLRGLYDHMREYSRDEGYSASDVQDAFEDWAGLHEAAGYGALRHVGGQLTGKKAHEVTIYLRPGRDLTLTKAEPPTRERGGPMSLATATPEPPHPSVAEAAARVGKAGDELATFKADAKLEGYDKPLPKPERPTATPEGIAITSAGRHVPVAYEVVEARDLIASHSDDMQPNPSFPAELQPRDRTRAASGAQVAAMAGSLEPALLGRSATASDGAPIVGPDAVVESGNARVLAIRKAYREAMPGAAAYREELARQGYDVAGMEAPVLVRRRTGEMAPADRATFAREANVSGVAAMGTAERAGSDAAALTPGRLDLLTSGDMHAAGNRPFVRAFLGSLPEGERAGLLTADGELSKAGGERLRNAVLAKAFGDPGLVARLAEEPETGLGGLGRVLADVAPEWAKMRAEAAAGRIAPEGDGTPALLEALHAITAAKAAGNPPHFALAQGDMLGGGLSPDGAAFLRSFLMLDKKGGSRVLGRDKLAAVLDRYVTAARKQQPGADMFGVGPAPPAGIIEGRKAPQTPAEKAAATAALPPELGEVEAMRREGTLTPADKATLAAGEAEAQKAEGYATAYETLVGCVLRNAV